MATVLEGKGSISPPVPMVKSEIPSRHAYYHRL